MLNDNIIGAGDLYLQDVVCAIVFSNPKEDDFEIYNKVVKMVDVNDIDDVNKILNLIKLNKTAIIT